MKKSEQHAIWAIIMFAVYFLERNDRAVIALSIAIVFLGVAIVYYFVEENCGKKD